MQTVCTLDKKLFIIVLFFPYFKNGSTLKKNIMKFGV